MLTEDENKRMGYRQESLKDMGCYTNAVPTRPVTEDTRERVIRDICYRLDYHAPSPDQLPRFQALRDAAKAFATVIIRNCPEYSDDLLGALQTVEATLMLANKSIALENQPKGL